MTPVIGR